MRPNARQALTIWAVSDGRAGMANQSLGLARELAKSLKAEDLEGEVVEKRLSIRAPWRWLPPQACPFPLAALGPEGDRLEATWPDIVIATGRRVLAQALAVKRAGRGKTFLVAIQNPRMNLAAFDAVVAPEHDGLSGKGVISTLGSVHRVAAETTRHAAKEVEALYSDLPRPILTALIGGPSRRHSLDIATAQRLAEQLQQAVTESGGSLLLTTSRRTPREVCDLLKQRLSKLPGEIWIYGQTPYGQKPARNSPTDKLYLAYLGLADSFLVTSDSTNLLSEAASTGKAIQVFHLPGEEGRFRILFDRLREKGIIKEFAGHYESWSYAPLEETKRAAEEILKRYNSRS